MLKKVERGMEKWGHYLLALLCAGVILVSARWTREEKSSEIENQMALADQSQRMANSEPTSMPIVWQRPAKGEITQGYSDEPVFFPETGVWKSHPCIDFSAREGENIQAMAAGTVLECGSALLIEHEDGSISTYQGMKEYAVREGQRVKAGETLGTMGDKVLYEGGGHVCVRVLKNGVPIEFKVN